MYLKVKANEKNDLIVEAEAEMCFERGVNSNLCIEYGQNTRERERKSEKKKRIPRQHWAWITRK